MQTSLLTSSKATSHASIAAELCRIAGLAKKGSKSLEDLLDAAVDALLAKQTETDSRYAELIYTRYADACIAWRSVGGNVDDTQTLAGVSDYTRESSAGIPSAATPHSRSFYHRPRPQYLSPATQEAICGPTAKQANWRKHLHETGRKGGLAKRQHPDNAAKQRAYRERIKAKLLASK